MAGIKNNREMDPVPNTAHGGIYEDGPYKVEVVNVSNESLSSCCLRSKSRVSAAAAVMENEIVPPKPLIVALPTEEGEYPVVQFHHGYTLQNTFYTQLISHIASYGFIVVAPQVSNQLSDHNTAFVSSLWVN